MDYTTNPAQWVEKFGDYLFNFAIRRLSTRELAEDLVQETFLSALDAGKKFSDEKQELRWLFSILRNKIIDAYRSQAKRMHEDFDDAVNFDHLFDHEGEWINDVKPWHTTPEQSLKEQQFREIFWDCIGKMKKKYQTPFIFRDIDGLPTDDVIELMNVSKTNFGVLIHRARIQMRLCLTNNWFGEKRA